MGNQAEEKIEQYIREISRHLVIPHDMKKRVESDLRTDFYLQIEAGKDVDEVIKEMGDPGETAASFNEELEGGKAATPWRFHKIFLVAAALGLLALYFLTSRSVLYGRNRGALLCSLAGTLCLISGFAAHIPIGMAEGQAQHTQEEIELMWTTKTRWPYGPRVSLSL